MRLGESRVGVVSHSLRSSMAPSIVGGMTGETRITTASWKVRENRLRAAANRQGLTLKRSPRRDTRALDYGKYWLFVGNVAVTPCEGMTIDEIEKYLTQHPSER